MALVAYSKAPWKEKRERLRGEGDVINFLGLDLEENTLYDAGKEENKKFAINCMVLR